MPAVAKYTLQSQLFPDDQIGLVCPACGEAFSLRRIHLLSDYHDCPGCERTALLPVVEEVDLLLGAGRLRS